MKNLIAIVIIIIIVFFVASNLSNKAQKLANKNYSQVTNSIDYINENK